MLLHDALQEFLYHIQVKNYTERTRKGYKNNNKAFIKYLQNEWKIEEVEEVKSSHIKAYMMYLKNKGRKETYINSIYKNIRSLFNYCVEEGYLTSKQNPCTNVKWMKEPKVIIQTFNDEEIKNMINAYKMTDYYEARNKLIIMMLVDTGIRNLELCKLTHNDVFETTIRIQGKGNKQRYIYISPILKKFMIKYERIKNYYFKDDIKAYSNYFLSYRGNPLTIEAVERVVRLAGVRAGVRSHIRCSPHTLRHYFAQKQLQNGLDVYSLSRLLGHEDIQITKRYLQSIEDEKIIEFGRNTSPLMNLRR